MNKLIVEIRMVHKNALIKTYEYDFNTSLLNNQVSPDAIHGFVHHLILRFISNQHTFSPKDVYAITRIIK